MSCLWFPRHTHLFSPGHFCCFLQKQMVSYSATKWQRRQKKHMYYLCGKIQVQNPQFQNTSLPVNDSNHTVNNILLHCKKNVVITKKIFCQINLNNLFSSDNIYFEFLMIKSISFIVLTQFFEFNQLKILRQPGYLLF